MNAPTMRDWKEIIPRLVLFCVVLNRVVGNMRLTTLALVISFGLMLAILETPVVIAETSIPDNPNTGPYINSILYKVIPDQDQRILCLQNRTIEIDSDLDYEVLVDYGWISEDPDIEIFNMLSNGYRLIEINCRDMPLNESVLRRAFAYAFDKTLVTIEIFDGWAHEQDSVLPFVNSWCIEDQLTPHYYANQTSIGNTLLDASGIFPIIGEYRTYRGIPFDIKLEYFASDYGHAAPMATVGLVTLQALHINASSCLSDYNECTSRLATHGNYDMVILEHSFDDYNVDWLAYEYWSQYADTPYHNPTNFKNATFDRCREQLLQGATYEEVCNASSWMQRILHEQVPVLVLCNSESLQAYRNDRFTGYVADLRSYISGLWTIRKIHQLNGIPGGSVPIGIPEDPDSFNIFIANSTEANMILDELYPSLFRYDPNMSPYNDLATNMLIEYHQNNSDVPLDHTRFTIDIVDNATWSDNIPLTSEDIAFTFNYIIESGAYGNSRASELGDLVYIQYPNPYRVIMEFDTESYWNFFKFAYTRIIPKHIFASDESIGYSGWNIWNPVFDSGAPVVTCGPFVLSNYAQGEYYNLTWNPLFYYGFNATLHEPQQTTTTTTTGIDVFGRPELYLIGVPIVLIIVYWAYRRRSMSREAYR